MDNKHKHFSKKQNETGFDPNGKFGYLVFILSFFLEWKNETIGWLRDIKKHAGENLTEADLEEIYSEYFNGNFTLIESNLTSILDWKSYPAMMDTKMHANSTHFKPMKLPPMKGE